MAMQCSVVVQKNYQLAILGMCVCASLCCVWMFQVFFMNASSWQMCKERERERVMSAEF